MFRPVRCLLALVSIGLACATPVLGQEDGAADVQRYRVEVILFEQTAGASTPEDPGLPELPPQTLLDPAALPEEDGSPPAPAADDPSLAAPLFFEPADGFAMSDVADRLRRRSGYRLLLHQAWTQPGFDRATAQPVDLARLDRVRAGGGAANRPAVSAIDTDGSLLSASATFYRSRYLHLILDVDRGDDGAGKIQERRRMRIGELHYFDAPGVGAVATVNRVERPDPVDVTP